MRKRSLALATCLLVAGGAPAAAQSAPDPSLELNLSSRGYSKGLAQTEGIQLLARGELLFRPLVLGAYWKNLSSDPGDGETGLAIGARRRLGPIEFGLTGTLKVYTDGRRSDDEALELTANAGGTIGRWQPRIAVTWSPDDLGSTGRSLWAEAGLGYRLAEGTTLSAFVGRRERNGGLDYTAFNIGLSQHVVGPFTLDLRYQDSSREAAGDVYRNRLVGSLRARF